MQKKIFIRVVSALTAILMSASLIAGCTSEKKSEGKASSESTQEKKLETPTPISLLVSTTAPETIDDTNIIWKEIEKLTNTKLTITFVPSSNFTEKVNVTVASGNMPDLTQVDPMAPNILSTALNGAFWDIGEYIKEFPEISKYPEDIWKNTRYPDGKNYILPKTRPLVGASNMISVRKDWLDKLNLKVPETLDEVTNVLKAFVNNDPDGTGQKDTIGLVGFIASDGTSMGSFNGLLSTAFGAHLGGYFYDKDGVLQSALTTPELKQAVSYLKKLYAEGLLHKDFATMKQQQVRDAGMSAKVGAMTENIPGSWVVTEGLHKVDPKGEFVAVPYLKTSNGSKFHLQGSGYNGGFAIKKQGNDEERLKKILGFIDKTSTNEIWELANYGVKDTHFTKNGDIYVLTEQAKKDKVGQYYMGQVASKFERFFYAYNAPNIPMASIEYNKKLVEEMEKVAKPSPMQGLISETWNKYSKEYDKKVTDQVMKTILGSESIDSWDAFAGKIADEENYKKSLAELQAAYKIKMGK